MFPRGQKQNVFDRNVVSGVTRMYEIGRIFGNKARILIPLHYYKENVFCSYLTRTDKKPFFFTLRIPKVTR